MTSYMRQALPKPSQAAGVCDGGGLDPRLGHRRQHQPVFAGERDVPAAPTGEGRPRARAADAARRVAEPALRPLLPRLPRLSRGHAGLRGPRSIHADAGAPECSPARPPSAPGSRPCRRTTSRWLDVRPGGRTTLRAGGRRGPGRGSPGGARATRIGRDALAATRASWDAQITLNGRGVHGDRRRPRELHRPLLGHGHERLRPLGDDRPAFAGGRQPAHRTRRSRLAPHGPAPAGPPSKRPAPRWRSWRSG